jgi:homoserine kinase type II
MRDKVGVFTRLDPRDARAIALAYGLGEVVEARGIPAGSVNSNYALACDQGRFFLRIYEEQDAAGGAAEARMLEALASKGVRTPAPLRVQESAATRDGAPTVAGKPVAVFPWRAGGMRCQASVGEDDARRLGAELARVHVAGEGVPVGAGRFRVEDLKQRVEVIRGATDPALAAQAPVLEAKLAEWTARRARAVAEGLIHGDLFRDNVLWEHESGGDIAALLDFESASRGRFVFDLMVTVLAWSFGAALDARIARGICDGYRGVRELGEDERAALLAEGCIAALRFTITRITDYAMKGGIGPRVLKDWRRFAMRLATFESLGDAGLRRALGLPAG